MAEPPDQMARDAVPLHLDAARPRRLPVLHRCALFLGRQSSTRRRCWSATARPMPAGRRASPSTRRSSRPRSRAATSSRRRSPATTTCRCATSRNVVALPPFVLGVKVPRYLPKAGAIEPEMLAVDAAGKPLAGVDMTVRFIKRNWTSVLQASDFSQGAAKYVTQVIDETLVERKVTSTAEAHALAFAGARGRRLPGAGRGERPHRPPPAGERRLLRRRRHAGDLGAPAGADRDGHHRQGSLHAGRDRDAGDPEPVPDRARTGGGRGAGRAFRYDWVDIANGFGRYAADRAQGADAAARGAFPDHARAPGRAAAPVPPRRSTRASR